MESIYTGQEYLEKNPTWHIEDSPWKASKVLKILNKNKVQVNRVCEVGCGAGEILNQLHAQMPSVSFDGYDISPDAYKLALQREKDRLKFHLKDFFEETSVYDLILCIDIIEHIEDYFSFLRKLKTRATYKVFHIPLEVAVLFILRSQLLNNHRDQFGHIHFFTKETALRALQDCGYEIIDWAYTPRAIEMPTDSVLKNLAKIPRKLLFSIDKDFAQRLLGGCSLMVLTK